MFQIVLEDRSIDVIRLEYSKTLNEINFWELALSGSDEIVSDTAIGGEVEIYAEGVLAIKGKIKKRDIYSGGNIKILGYGFERELVKSRCPMVSGNRKVYTSTNDNAVFTELVESVSGWTADVSNSTLVALDSFRTSKSMSVWRAIKRLISLVGKDINVNYSTKTLELHDSVGDADAFSFIDNRNISNVKIEENEPEGDKVIVYGKGDGDGQIIGEAGIGNNIIERIDRNIITTDEANERAAKELAAIENSLENHSFELIDKTISVGLGDTGDFVSSVFGFAEQTVSVVRIRRGINPNGSEINEVEVSNTEYRKAKKSLQSNVLSSEEDMNIDNSSMQGSGNITSFVTSDSVNNDKSMFLEFNVGNNFLDDSEELSIKKLEMDYILDPFIIQGGGTVSETNRSPSLSGNTANHRHDPSSPSHNHGTSATTSGTVSTSGDHNENEAIGVSISNGIELARIAKIPNLGSAVSDMDWAIVTVSVSVGTKGSNAIRLRIRNLDASSTAYDENINLLNNGSFTVTVIFVGIDCYGNDEVEARFYNNSGAGADVTLSISVSSVLRHTHSVNIGNVSGTSASVSDNDRSPSLSGNTISHNHSVSISGGDASVDDINGSSVTIVLQKFDGTSWNDVETKTISEIFEIDIDWTEHITTGLHRFKFNTNNSGFDHSRAVIRIKHLLEG